MLGLVGVTDGQGEFGPLGGNQPLLNLLAGPVTNKSLTIYGTLTVTNGNVDTKYLRVDNDVTIGSGANDLEHVRAFWVTYAKEAKLGANYSVIEFPRKKSFPERLSETQGQGQKRFSFRR